MPQSNIQVLFARISAADIREYLTSHGWQAEIPLQADTMRFTASGKSPGEVSELWQWASDDHPKFRRRVPDILFSLCLHEDRPALDIANEMFGMGQRALAQAQAAAAERQVVVAPLVEGTSRLPVSPGDRTTGETRGFAPPRWSFTHRGIDSLLVQLLPEGGAHTLEPGDRLWIIAEEAAEMAPQGGISASLVDVEWTESAVRMHTAAAGPRPRFLLGRSDDARADSVESLVVRELRELPGEKADQSSEDLLEGLRDTLQRASFELQSDGEPDEILRQVALRQTALLAAALARGLPESPWARRTLWRVAMRLLARTGLALELTASAVDELFTKALADPENIPTQTLAFLRHHTLAV